MLKLSKGMICLFLGVISIGAFASGASKVYSQAQAQEIVIPGYTPPASSSPSQPNSTQSLPEVVQLNNTNAPNPIPAAFKIPLTPETMHKSCERLIALNIPYEAIQDNFKKGFIDAGTGNIYQWIREGEPNLVITFLDSNTPIAVSGNLPPNIPNAKELHFSLSDVQQALNLPGKIIGYLHVFSPNRGEGKLIIYTDAKNVVTKFTTDFSCDLK